MKIHAPLLPVAVCLLTGVAMHGWLTDWTTGLAALAVCVIVTVLLYRWPRCQTAGIWLCFLVLGMTLGARKQQRMEVEWPEGAVDMEVVVMGEPVVKERHVVLDVLTATGHHLLKLRLQRDEASERITVGEGLLIHTNIKKVHAWESGHFSYRRYMHCQGFTGEAFVNSRHWRGQEVSLKGLSATERTRLRFLCWRHQLLERYRQWGVSDDAYGVLAAMTLGEKSHIDRQLRETYSQVGASHILALSGLHLMIIYGVIALLVSWRRIRTLSQVVIVLAIWAFALLTGLSPSILRSASMISIYALLAVGHRQRMSVNTLAFVAIVMIIINPLAIYDIGFQLSFTAVLAIILINPLLYELIPAHVRQRHRWLSSLWGLTTISISAQVGTAPLVAYHFGYFATWFLLTNYIVIPLATGVLYLTVALLAVSWWPWAAGWVATALSAVVIFMNRLLEWISSLPHCTVDGIRITALQTALLYVVIACACVLFGIASRRLTDYR